MADRENILARLAQNKPPQVALPEVVVPAPQNADLVAQFTAVVREIGGEVLTVTDGTIQAVLSKIHPQLTPVFASDVPADGSLADLQLFVCKGEVGVAENGAIWVAEDGESGRVLKISAK